MRFLTSLLALLLALSIRSSAEGTREMAPNAAIVVNGNTTNDLAALHINNPEYNSFASFDNPDPHSRLYIHVTDPSKECIYMGFSFGHVNGNNTTPPRVPYQYRVKDPAGNIVFGPIAVPVDGANIITWSEAFTGPMQVQGAGGYNAQEVTSAALASQGWSGAGDFYVEFESPNGDCLIDYWDITVADCSTPILEGKKGRVWSYNWSIFAVNDFGFPNRPFNGAFYVCAPDPDDPDAAFITKIDFNGSGFRPAAFNIAFNSFGVNNTGDITEDRKSVEGLNATQSEYAIFLNDPIELCKTAVVGEIELLGIGRCDAGDYCIKFSTSKEGQIDLLLDFDGADGIYTAFTRDVLIPHFVTADEVGQPSCISWDGRDGLGNLLPEVAGTQIPIVIAYAQGIYHFPIYDAEFMTIGFMLDAVRPAAIIPLLHYDDSNISFVSGSGEPPVQINGCNVPCHRWTNFNSMANTGYGNLNTINSWWFSQRIVRQDVLLLPAYYTCEVDGPQSICAGSTTQIVFQPQVHPSELTGPDIISTTWTGPGIISPDTVNTITIDEAGTYHVNIIWLSGVGDTCQASCEYLLVIDPPLTSTIDTLILLGDIIDINGQLYSEGGQYIQEFVTVNGCDSILTINIKVINTVIHYDLNGCIGNIEDGTNMDYSEFTASYPEPLSCADITADIIFRFPPQMNKHSCTPGVNNSVAMCISSQDTCDYDPGNQASLVFEVTISPDPDTAVHLTGFSFFEKAPVTYNWIDGASGLNNYPTLFGMRVLKNGVEIYRQEDIATTTGWTARIFDFLEDDEFIVGETTTFRFELLPYCLVGNGAVVAAWDIDEVNVQASCVSLSELNKIISGTVKTPQGNPVKDVQITLSEEPVPASGQIRMTDADGKYLFESNLPGKDYYLTGEKNTDFKNGVSTLDLVMIQKHLLGITPFDSPYKYVAADANHSQTVSAIDLIELRKLILGIYTILPRNKSWRFGNADASWSGSYPFGFKETIDIEALNDDIYNADFVGVKIGDINGDVQAGFNFKVVPRQYETMELLIEDKFAYAGEPIQVDITADHFDDIVGFQFALDLNDVYIQNVKSGKIQVNEDNYIHSGEAFRLSWNHFEPLSVRKDEVLFSLVLVPGLNSQISKLMSINQESMHAEAYVGEEPEKMDLDMQFDYSSAAFQENQFFQNDPNPFSERTTIRFNLKNAAQASIRFYNVSGQLLNEINGKYDKGMNEVEISIHELGVNEGVVICQLQADGFSETIKLVLIK